MRFLIIKMSALGDIVHAYPVLRRLKNEFPDAQVDWAVEKKMAGLVTSHPLVDRVIPLDTKGKKTIHSLYSDIKNLRKERYDAIFDLQGNSKSALISLLARGKKRVSFGFKTAPEFLGACMASYRVNPTKGQNIRHDYLEIVEHYFGLRAEAVGAVTLTCEETPIAVPSCSWLVCPGSAWPNKKLSKEFLQEFLERLKGTYSPTLFFLAGSDSEKKEAEYLALQFQGKVVDRPPFPLLQQTMKSMELVIAMDSLPLHLAATTAVATFSLFGPSSAAKYAPCGTQHIAVQGSCPYGETFEKRCSKLRTCPTGACMHNRDLDTLVETFSRWYEAMPRPEGRG